jgi:hypothetical protein
MSDPHGIIDPYRKGGSIMSSFLENENEMLIDAIYSEIGEQLVEDWMNSNLDEGQLYADWCVADMSNSNYLKGRFNQFYNLSPTDNYYLQWDEEA